MKVFELVNLELFHEVSKAKKFTELKEGWDDEDAQRISKETVERLAVFIDKEAKLYWTAKEKGLPLPSINPVSNGSMDIFWHSIGLDFLVNIPADGEEPITFYGGSTLGREIRGKDVESKSIVLHALTPECTVCSTSLKEQVRLCDYCKSLWEESYEGP